LANEDRVADNFCQLEALERAVETSAPRAECGLDEEPDAPAAPGV